MEKYEETLDGRSSSVSCSHDSLRGTVRSETPESLMPVSWTGRLRVPGAVTPPVGLPGRCSRRASPLRNRPRSRTPTSLHLVRLLLLPFSGEVLLCLRLFEPPFTSRTQPHRRFKILRRFRTFGRPSSHRTLGPFPPWLREVGVRRGTVKWDSPFQTF